MTRFIATPKPKPLVYPESDGLPMAENTVQFNCIVAVKENLEILFADNPQVFVAGDLLWYPQEGNVKLRVAPDALVAFGVPKGDRGSYRQWEERGIAPQVVFEILSPGNRLAEMTDKFAFYDRHGVEEYYVYDPDDGLWSGWCRADGGLDRIEPMHNWVSPRLGIRFESVEGAPLSLFHPNGERFLSPLETERRRLEAEERRREAEDRLELERLAREQATHRADQAESRTQAAQQETQAALQETRAARQLAQAAQQQAQLATDRAAQLETLLRTAGIDPNAL